MEPRLLTLLPYESAALRRPSQDVSFPLDEETLTLVRDMRYSIQPAQLAKACAPWPSAAGMAAIQWGVEKRVFLWRFGEGDYEVAINATYEPIGEEEVVAQEGCFSVPKCRGQVRRWRRIRATFLDESGQLQERELHDWPARIFQHETDHTFGRLYDDEHAARCIAKTFL